MRPKNASDFANETRGAATIRVRRPSGAVRCFLAEAVEIADTWIGATGHFKGEQRRETVVWAANRVIELRFEEGPR